MIWYKTGSRGGKITAEIVKETGYATKVVSTLKALELRVTTISVLVLMWRIERDKFLHPYTLPLSKVGHNANIPAILDAKVRKTTEIYILDRPFYCVMRCESRLCQYSLHSCLAICGGGLFA